MGNIKYGRGKFDVPSSYIKYINMIADSPNYEGLPARREPNGKINWQCSNGKTTSFYKYFESRKNWWVKKADELGIDGSGDINGRLTVAARIIHPTKKKVCLICGKERYIGYMYMNKNFANSWNKLLGENLFHARTLISDAVIELVKHIGKEKTREIIFKAFPEKIKYINLFDSGDYLKFFLATQHIRSSKLSPGFMGDCPHRLDGIHDYCTFCRKKNDPGRSDENMQTYNHDRRAFIWWAEGDWKLADTLYDSATSGVCANCGRTVKKISPDHVGPLACGFKQNGFFEPLCNRCNSAKNRRFTYDNVKSLINYEYEHRESVVSWQVRSLWDSVKYKVQNDDEVRTLSNYMRAMQDYYLRTLYLIAQTAHFEFLSTYLHPEYANYLITFERLNTSTLKFDSFKKTYAPTNGSRSLAARSVRIAFEELEEYQAKSTKKRKSIILNKTNEFLDEDSKIIFKLFSTIPLSKIDKSLYSILSSSSSTDEKDRRIQDIIESEEFKSRNNRYNIVKNNYRKIIDKRGKELAMICLNEI